MEKDHKKIVDDFRSNRSKFRKEISTLSEELSFVLKALHIQNKKHNDGIPS